MYIHILLEKEYLNVYLHFKTKRFTNPYLKAFDNKDNKKQFQNTLMTRFHVGFEIKWPLIITIIHI